MPLIDDPILTNILPVGAEDIHHPDTKQFIANSWKRFAKDMDTRSREARLALLRNLTKEWDDNYRRKWKAASTSGVMMDIRQLAARSGLTGWLSRQPTPTANELRNYYAHLVDYSAAINDTIGEVSPHLAFAAHRVANVRPNDTVCVDWAGDGLIATFLGDHQNVQFSDPFPLRRAIFNQLYPEKQIGEAGRAVEGGFDILFTKGFGSIPIRTLLNRVSPGGRLVIYGDSDSLRMFSSMIQNLGKYNTIPEFIVSLPPTLNAEIARSYIDMFIQLEDFDRKVAGNFTFKVDETEYGSEGGAVIVIDNVPGTETNSEIFNMGNTQARPLSDYVTSFDKVRETRTGSSREMLRHSQIEMEVQRKHQQAEKRRKAAVHNAANRDGAKIFRNHPEAEGQEKHMKPIDVSQAAHREFHIRQICKERKITTLVHFTRIENLRSILQEGLIGRSLLEAREQQFLFNDNDRVDGHKEAVCLSISFPNYQMFYSIREEKKETQEANDSQWVILLLDAKVLWELDCAFCQDNAARKAISNTSLEERKKTDALETMFGDFYDIRHQDLLIPKNYPTHPQAEVLVFNPIPVWSIKAIYFWDTDAQDRWLPYNINTNYETFCADRTYFKYRSDYEVWKPENFKDGIPRSYIAKNNAGRSLSVSADDDHDLPF